MFQGVWLWNTCFQIKQNIIKKKIVFTVALSSVDKHKKYRRFDKSMIYLSQSLARQSVFSSFLCHVCI